MNKVNLLQKFSLIEDHWNPRIVGELNGQYVKLVKFQGPFTWHHHESEDEMFLVVKGRLRMEFHDQPGGPVASIPAKEIWLEEGEFCIVPSRSGTPAGCRSGMLRSLVRAGNYAQHRQRAG